MSLSRREFLRLSALLSAAAGACSPLYQRVSGLPGPMRSSPNLEERAQQILGRAAFGPGSFEADRIDRTGIGGWLEEQLSPQAQDDDPVQILLRRLDALEMDAAGLESWEKEDVLRQLRAGTLLRRVYGRRQLYERMVEYWTDHFNIYVEKGECWMLKVVDDREVIRPHALGRFEDLLLASARSPAMLIYLDNQANEASAPNENYAREVMELHTLGVDGGYSQEDVMELARCLTGWTVKDHFWKGEFVFKSELHDKGVKHVMGQRIEPAGEREAEDVLKRLARHESTAIYIAENLVRRFVTDRPHEHAPDLVQEVARTFRVTDGDLRRVARTLFLDGLLQHEGPLPPKFKRPVDLVVSALRALHATTDGADGLQGQLAQMGQLPFDWPTPDGPPDTANDWSASLLPRWQFALRLARNEIDGTELPLEDIGANVDEEPSTVVDRLSRRLLGRPADQRLISAVHQALTQGGDPARAELPALTVAGLVASPEFQWR